jgi:hypothetical protein
MKNKILNFIIGILASLMAVTVFALIESFTKIKIDPFFVGYVCGCIFMWVGFD